MQPSTPLAVYAAFEGAVIFTAAAAGAGTPDDTWAWISTLGPFSIAIGLSYYLLRRSDERERRAKQHHTDANACCVTNSLILVLRRQHCAPRSDSSERKKHMSRWRSGHSNTRRAMGGRRGQRPSSGAYWRSVRARRSDRLGPRAGRRLRRDYKLIAGSFLGGLIVWLFTTLAAPPKVNDSGP